jgi:tellurite resistance protein TehA-like permease
MNDHPRMSAGRLRELEPGYFALVMATGIVSIAMLDHSPYLVSDALQWLGAAEYAVLIGLHGWRVRRHRDAVAADLTEPRRVFGLLTFVAATDVLGTRFALGGHRTTGLVLLVVGSLAWLVLGYLVPWAAASGRGGRPAVRDADGRWFMWVVAGQSVAVLAATLEPAVHDGRRELALLAVFAWSVGVLLYGTAGILVAVRLLRYPLRPAELIPQYWVAMGATAITVVAAADIVRMSGTPVRGAVHGLVEGAAVVFWAFGTWLIPPLIAAGFWRHVRHRVPLRYEPALWSIVFPLGMYGVGSHDLGRAADLSIVRAIGTQEGWVALAAWLVTFVAMLLSVAAVLRAVPAREAAPRSSGGNRAEH